MKYAEQIIVHKVRSAWFEMSRMFNQVASAYNITLSVGFTLIAIYEKDGTPVTKIVLVWVWNQIVFLAY